MLLELGDHQSYQLKPLHEEDVIELSVAREPDLSAEEISQANSDFVNLVTTVHEFIKESVDQNMTTAFKEFSIDCYIPCEECGKLHIKYEKAIKSKKALCKAKNTYCDILPYHKVLSTTGISHTNYLFIPCKSLLLQLVARVVF